mgnify:CR=1 FL=1
MNASTKRKIGPVELDLGFGLDIVDWIMEPGSDEAYRDKLAGDLPYVFNNLYHGKVAKRSIEGPQICTQAKELKPTVITGTDFVAVKQEYAYTLAAPGKKTGSKWEQTVVFPHGKRYFVSADKITAKNASEAMRIERLRARLFPAVASACSAASMSSWATSMSPP